MFKFCLPVCEADLGTGLVVEPVLHLVWANMVFSKASVTGSTICVFKVKQ